MQTLADKTQSSRAALTKLLKGTTDFRIDSYDKLITAFGPSVEAVLSGAELSELQRHHPDLYEQFGVAVRNAEITGTVAVLTHVVEGLKLKSIEDRQLLGETPGASQPTGKTPKKRVK